MSYSELHPAGLEIVLTTFCSNDNLDRRGVHEREMSLKQELQTWSNALTAFNEKDLSLSLSLFSVSGVT